MNAVSLSSSQRTVLFTDMRHIRCGDLDWLDQDAQKLPLVNPSATQVEARAVENFVPHGIRIVAQQATKVGVLRAGARLGRIIYDGGTYRSWYMEAKYQSGPNLGEYATDVPESVFVCHVESNDGLEWSDPVKCQVRVPGQIGPDGLTVFIDPNAPTNGSYKAVYMARPPQEQLPLLWEQYQNVHPRHRDFRLTQEYITCLYGLLSPDGIHWEPIPEPLMIHKSDTDTSIYYDSHLGRYVMYTRLFKQDRRLIARAETEDFRNWGPVNPVIWPVPEDGFSSDVYTNARTDYPDMPEYHLMFPMFYHRYTQTSDIRMFSSPDGICWTRVPGAPVLSPGNPGEWDSEFVVAGHDLVPFGRDSVGISYLGTSFPHKYPRWRDVLDAMRIGWAIWPKGRLSAVVADEEGEVFTMPLTPAGRTLKLNVRTRRAGSVRVGLVGYPDRCADDCDPVSGDGFSLPVRWKGKSDIGVREGEKVTLYFRLRAADLFGFEWD